ncbi:MAG: small multi-drug export protein [Planctomycetota bacterium]
MATKTTSPETIELGETSLQDALGEVEEAARSIPRRWAFAILPIISTALLLPAFLLFFGPTAAWEGLRLAVLSCVSAGKLSLLEAGKLGTFEPFALAGGVLYVDLCFALPLAYNLDLLFRLPHAGEYLRALEARSRTLLHNSAWKKTLTHGGLILFVAIPLGGTGAVGGAFFGRLLGLSRSRTLSGIVIGSLLGNAGLATGAHLWPTGWLYRLLEQPVFGPLGAAVTMVVVAILILRLRSVHR